MEPEWQSIGVVGILALFLVRETFQFLQQNKTHGKSAIEAARAGAELQAELRKLVHAINNLSQIAQNLTHEMKSTQAEVRECRKDIEEIQRRLK